jgi:hypothetical protein
MLDKKVTDACGSHGGGKKEDSPVCKKRINIKAEVKYIGI